MEPENSYHPEVLEEKTPVLLSEIISYVQYVYATFGWYILGLTLLALYFWNKVQPYYEKWRKDREEKAFAAQMHRLSGTDSDPYRARQEAIVAARLRMQEEHDRLAALQAEKAKEREDKKREEWIARQVNSGNPGYRLSGNNRSNSTEAQPGSSKTKGSSFRPEYNPLMGAGSSGGYRPTKRGCPGGGCGKK